MLYQQLDYPLVLLLYSQYEGRVSRILYRIGKDRIRVEKKKKRHEKKKIKRKREQDRKRVRETGVKHDRRFTVDTSYELH